MEREWMERALALARVAESHEEVPVGAVVVLDGQLIGAGYNQVRMRRDPCAHAEIEAIRHACQQVHNERLPMSTLYVTLEPCLMCMGALLHARISRLVFAARDFQAGAAGSQWNMANGFGVYAPIQVDEGLGQEESTLLLQRFFKSRR